MTGKTNLVLIPGMLCDEAAWAFQVSHLGDICSPFVTTGHWRENLTLCAQEVLKRAPASFALVGYSLGGRVAQEIVKLSSERVSALALLATDYRGHLSSASRKAEYERRDRMLASARTMGMDGLAREWVKEVLAPENLKNPGLVSAAVAMIARQSADVLARQLQAGMSREDRTAFLGEIRIPTLVCVGDHDALRSVALHRDMAARISHSRFAVIEGAGHMLTMERPEAATAALRQWLSAS